ncbi:MAG: energy-coupling factor transporter transmembrane protein EcfT [Methanosarcinaceae archaeon]|nr:energy-coupling factor transporter transmembrane protein EcfT [Methanosarcinaceae archaeon]
MRWLFRYEQKDTVIHRLDPRVKLVWLFGLSILTVVLGVPWLLVLLFLSTLPFWFMLAPSISKIRAMVWLFGAIVLGFVISQSLFYYWAEEPFLTIVPSTFPVIGYLTGGICLYSDGAMYGLFQSFRFMTTVSAAMVVVATTHPSELIIALVRFSCLKVGNREYHIGLPYEIAFMVSSAVSFAPSMIEECAIIVNSMKARGLELKGGISTKIKALRYLFVPMVINILRGGRQIAIAADARGFRATANRTYVKELKLKGNDYVFLLYTVVFTVTGLYLSFIGFGGTAPI